jgi:hypothetical protein
LLRENAVCGFSSPQREQRFVGSSVMAVLLLWAGATGAEMSDNDNPRFMMTAELIEALRAADPTGKLLVILTYDHSIDGDEVMDILRISRVSGDGETVGIDVACVDRL